MADQREAPPNLATKAFAFPSMKGFGFGVLVFWGSIAAVAR
jgi:hypothetical protein